MLDIQTKSDLILPLSEHNVDLRRALRRDTAEILTRRAIYLSLDDRTLVHAVYARGATLREVANLTGRCPRALSYRLRALVRRVQSPEFVYVIQHTDEFLGTAPPSPSDSPANRLPPLPPTVNARIARECILEGKPMRVLARELGLSYHLLRQKHAAIRARALAARRERRAATASPSTSVGARR